MWDDAEDHFLTGTTEDGATPNKAILPADVNTWGLLALGDPAKYGRGIKWVEDNCLVDDSGFHGFDFNNDRDGIWWEATAHMVLAYALMGDSAKASFYLRVLQRVQPEAPGTNGRGLVAWQWGEPHDQFGVVLHAPLAHCCHRLVHLCPAPI